MYPNAQSPQGYPQDYAQPPAAPPEPPTPLAAEAETEVPFQLSFKKLGILISAVMIVVFGLVMLTGDEDNGQAVSVNLTGTEIVANTITDSETGAIEVLYSHPQLQYSIKTPGSWQRVPDQEAAQFSTLVLLSPDYRVAESSGGRELSNGVLLQVVARATQATNLGEVVSDPRVVRQGVYVDPNEIKNRQIRKLSGTTALTYDTKAGNLDATITTFVRNGAAFDIIALYPSGERNIMIAEYERIVDSFEFLDQ